MTTSLRSDHSFLTALQIEVLQSYFDGEDLGADIDPENQATEMFMLPTTPPKTRQELISYLPPKNVVDRLAMRYFNAHSPSQRAWPLFTMNPRVYYTKAKL